MYRSTHLALAIGLMAGIISNANAQSRIPWVTNLVQARQMAQQHQRLILMHFWSNACPPCLKLERTVFNRPEVVRAISTNYVPLKINVSDNEALAQQYKVDRWPTDIITTADGQEVFRGVSQQDPNRYIALLDQVAAHARVRMPIASSPSTMPAQARPPQPDPRSSAFPAAGYSPNPSAVASAQAGQPSVAPPARTMIPNPYIGGPQMGSPGQSAPAQQSAIMPPYGRQVMPGAMAMQAPAAPVPPATSGTTIHQPPAAPARSAQTLEQPTYVAANRSPAPQVPTATAHADAMAGPGSRPSQPTKDPETAPGPPPLALEGYCPVTLVEQGKWVKGNAKWGAIHRGKTYLFAGEQEQKRFFGAFDRYAPVLSGYDPVRYVQTGILVEGQRAHGVFYQDQIYLFVDEASLQQFWTAPERYAPVALSKQQTPPNLSRH